jgi:hypothetical protein
MVGALPVAFCIAMFRAATPDTSFNENMTHLTLAAACDMVYAPGMLEKPTVNYSRSGLKEKWKFPVGCAILSRYVS